MSIHCTVKVTIRHTEARFDGSNETIIYLEVKLLLQQGIVANLLTEFAEKEEYRSLKVK